MSAPFQVAQAAGTGTRAPRTVTLAKPQDKQAVLVELDGTTRIDLSAISGERTTLVRKGPQLVILFDNQSTITLFPFFDDAGAVRPGLVFDLDAGRTLSGEQFAAIFPVTTDTTILPAAGETVVSHGFNFSGPVVDSLQGNSALSLLNADLGRAASGFGGSDGPNLPNDGVVPPVIFLTVAPPPPPPPPPPIDVAPNQTGGFNGIVEEEHLNPGLSALIHAVGIEDDTANPDSDSDTANDPGQTTHQLTGDFSSLVDSGNAPLTYGLDTSVNGSQALFAGGGSVTSNGAPVIFGVDGNTLYGFVNNDASLAYNPNADRLVFQLDLTPTSGAFTFTLFDRIDGHDIAAADGQEGIRTIDLSNIVTVVDADGDAIALDDVTIDVIDDRPVSETISAATSDAGTAQINLMVILDISSKPLGLGPDLGTARAALTELFEQYQSQGDVQVRLITFADTAQVHGSQWFSIDGAKAVLAALTTGGDSDYDAALAAAQTAFGDPGRLTGPGAVNVSYFLSDGLAEEPDGSVGVSASEQAAWENFLSANGIVSHALATGPFNLISGLEPIAYNGVTGQNTTPVLVSDLSQLPPLVVQAATSLVPITGTVPIQFGADGGHVRSVESGGDVYNYNPVTGTFTGPGSFSFDPARNVLTIPLSSGGSFAIDIDDGSYTYTPSSTAGVSEKIGVTLVDGDGDAATTTLLIDVVNDTAPIVRNDRVITNQEAAPGPDQIAIPEFALLYNDFDANGDAISISEVGGSNDGGPVSRGGGFITYTEQSDDAVDGGTFSYKGSTFGKPFIPTDIADVSIDRTQRGQDVLTGTLLSDILIGRDNAADFFIDGSDDDVVLGLGGRDRFRVSAGNDLYIGGAGEDFLVFETGVVVALPGGGTGVLDLGAFGLGIDQIREFEGLIGSDLPDVLQGNDTRNIILGQGGVDTVEGLGDDDILAGGASNDIVRGGAGNDLIYVAGNEALAEIIDGGAGHDTIVLGFYDPLTGIETASTVTLSSFNPDGVESMRSVGGAEGQIRGTTGDDHLDFSGITMLSAMNIALSISLAPPFPFDSDTVVTSWDHVGETSYTRFSVNFFTGEIAAGFITIVFSPDQLEEILSTPQLRSGSDGLQDNFDGSFEDETIPGGGINLELGDSSWNANVFGFLDGEMALAAGSSNYVAYTAMGENLPDFTPGVTGDSADNTLVGSDGDDILQGLVGLDILVGLAGDDFLDGGIQSDLLLGGDGDDQLLGGPAFDILSGGAGNDDFIFDEPGEGLDAIVDFDNGDEILINTSVFDPGLPSSGTAESNGIYGEGSDRNAAGANVRFFYDSDSGDNTLWYDTDASAAGQAWVELATLENGYDLSGNEIRMIP